MFFMFSFVFFLNLLTANIIASISRDKQNQYQRQNRAKCGGKHTYIHTYKPGGAASRASANRSDFRACEEPLSEVYMVKFSFYSKLVWVISTLDRDRKLLEHFILIVVTLFLNILLF